MAHKGTLYILIGDSNDRNTVMSQCDPGEMGHGRYPWAFVDKAGKPKMCPKCMACRNAASNDTWVNLMLFGMTLRGCHAPQDEFADNGAPDAALRVQGMLPLVLEMYGSSHRRIVVSMHDGMWSLLALSSDCPAFPMLDSHASSQFSSEWLDAVRTQLVAPVWQALGKYAGRTHLMWRTLPTVCGQPDLSAAGPCRAAATGQLFSQRCIANWASLTTRAARPFLCDERLTVADWRSVACSVFSWQNMSDGLHWQRDVYSTFAKVTRAAVDAPAAHGACGLRQPSVPECELSRCLPMAPGDTDDDAYL
jgi:hypothetical protein